MASEKKYYWLKLKDDFFEDETISFIEEQENGIAYSNFYLKLCLKSIKHDGKLIRLVGETLIPYDMNSLAKLTNTKIDTVVVAMKLFEQIGVVTRLETGELYMNQIKEMIGGETKQAEIMRRKRAEEKISGNNVTQMLPECYTEIKRKRLEEKQKEKIKFDENCNKDFELIWEIYPNKQGKIKAQSAYIKLITGKGADKVKYTNKEIWEAVNNYAQKVAKDGTDKKFIQHGSTFFNSGIFDYIEKEVFEDEQK